MTLILLCVTIVIQNTVEDWKRKKEKQRRSFHNNHGTCRYCTAVVVVRSTSHAKDRKHLGRAAQQKYSLTSTIALPSFWTRVFFYSASPCSGYVSSGVEQTSSCLCYLHPLKNFSNSSVIASVVQGFLAVRIAQRSTQKATSIQCSCPTIQALNSV